MSERGLIVIVSPGFKVYRGVPGLINWRSHDRLNRFVRTGVFTGADHDWLLFGSPLGDAVGSVLLGGCALPSAKSTHSKAEEMLKSWIDRHQHVWKGMKLKEMVWSVSEEWLPHVELWAALFHNDRYVDVKRLEALEATEKHVQKELT